MLNYIVHRFEFFGDYIKASAQGAGGLMATLLNVTSLLVGIAAVPVIVVLLGFDRRSVIVAFVVFLLLLILTHYGPFRAYQAARRRIRGLEGTFNVFESDRAEERAKLPQILWERHEVKKIAIRDRLGRVVAEPHFARIYFTNRPLLPSREVAERVAAHVTFKNRKGNPVCQMTGVWANDPESNNGGSREVDILPNGLPACLTIALKYEDEPECFACNDDNRVRDAKWKDPDKRLPPGAYLVEIEMLGLGVKHTTRAVLTNKGLGDPPKLDFVNGSFTQH